MYLNVSGKFVICSDKKNKKLAGSVKKFRNLLLFFAGFNVLVFVVLVLFT